MEREIILTESIVNDILRYCEDKQACDELGAYGDFYHKLKKATESENKVAVYVE